MTTPSEQGLHASRVLLFGLHAFTKRARWWARFPLPSSITSSTQTSFVERMYGNEAVCVTWGHSNRFVIVWPANINAFKSESEGRKVSKASCCGNPIVAEMSEALTHLKVKKVALLRLRSWKCAY